MWFVTNKTNCIKLKKFEKKSNHSFIYRIIKLQKAI